MIPTQNEITHDVEFIEQPSYTYSMNLMGDSVIGNCTGIEAVKQGMYKILNTERYQTAIYSRNYGVEFTDLMGMPKNYCVPEIERRITEALLQDDRIKKVYNFNFTFPKKNTIYVTFNVDTTEGKTSGEKEVSV